MSLLDEVNEGLRNDEGFWQWRTGFEILEDQIIDERRWHVRRRQVVSKGDELVAVEFNEGATEYQDDTPMGGEAYEVKPVEVTVTKYERI